MTGSSREPIDAGTAFGYRGEPGNAEQDLLRGGMPEDKRRALGESIARRAGELRNASPADVERMLADANGAEGRADPGDDLRVYTYDIPEPPDRPVGGEV